MIPYYKVLKKNGTIYPITRRRTLAIDDEFQIPPIELVCSNPSVVSNHDAPTPRSCMAIFGARPAFERHLEDTDSRVGQKMDVAQDHAGSSWEKPFPPPTTPDASRARPKEGTGLYLEPC
jgi:hypothetical protein